MQSNLARSLFAAVLALLWTASVSAQSPGYILTGRFSGLVFNRTTQTFNAILTLSNTGGTAAFAPISVVIQNATGAVTVAGSVDGSTFVASVPGGSLSPGASSSAVVAFINPGRTAFTPVIASITPRSPLTTLFSFGGSNTLDGANPLAGLIEGTDGNLYSTTQNGGAQSVGDVFRITPTGAISSIYSFGSLPDDADGGAPVALLLGKDGNFYGATEGGGANGDGTIFKLTPAGALTTLHSFNGTDGSAPVSLMQASDGNLYGTTPEGGANGAGTVFSITLGGALSTLHSFKGSDGSLATASLVQGTDGNFYGVTEEGGAKGYGSVFRITASGAFTSLYSFSGTDGAYPAEALVQGSDGNFYGATGAGGIDFGPFVIDGFTFQGIGYGTLFEITPSGALTTLHEFSGSDGSLPTAALALASDGNFYGSTYTGGTNNDGTLFKMTPGGTLTTLYNFKGSDGKLPDAPLLQASDGNFYGTTHSGGTASTNILDSGTVFKLSLGLAAP